MQPKTASKYDQGGGRVALNAVRSPFTHRSRRARRAQFRRGPQQVQMEKLCVQLSSPNESWTTGNAGAHGRGGPFTLSGARFYHTAACSLLCGVHALCDHRRVVVVR